MANTPNLPEFPDFVKELAPEALPVAQVHLLADISAQMASIRILLCELVGRQKFPDTDEEIEEIASVVDASRKHVMDSYTKIMLWLLKKYPADKS